MRKLIVLLVVLGIVGLIGLRLYEEMGSATPAAGGGPGRPGGGFRPTMLVETDLVAPRDFDTTLEVLGELRARASVEVMSRISGRLETLLVELGDRVRKGQLVARVEDEDLQQQIRRSEASVAVSEAAKRREQATVENLQVQLRRFRRLHDEALVSIQDLQDLESRVAVAQSQFELAVAQQQQAEAALRELKIQLEQASIYSPLDGVVGARYLDPGALVSPSVPIVSVLDLARVKTVVPVPERTLEAVTVGLPSEIIVDAFPTQLYRGQVTRISPFLNPQTRSADVEIEIPNPGEMLKPGMFARVKIEVHFLQKALSIPRSGLLQRGAEKGVYVIDDQMRTVFRPVQIGRIQGNFVEILEGLEPAMEIITTGAQNLNEGDVVKRAEKATGE